MEYILSIIGYIISAGSGLVALGLSSFGVYALLVEKGHMAPIQAIEGLF